MDNLICCRCPGCSGKIRIPVSLVAKRVKCTKCNCAFVADLAFSPIGAPDPPVAQPVAEPATSKPTTADHRQSAPPRYDGRGVSSAAVPPPLLQSVPAEITELIEDTDEHEHYKPVQYERKMEREERRPSGGLSVKWTYRFFYYFFCTLFITVIWLPIIRLLIFHLASAFAALLTSKFQCPGCHLVYPARTIWKCSCGFQPHYEKHILAFVCRLCGKYIGHTKCESCGTTIFVR